MVIKKILPIKQKEIVVKNEGLTRLVSAFVAATAQRFSNLYGVDYLFSLGGEPVYPSDLGNQDCLLPVVAWHANTLHKQGLNFPMGLLLLDNEEAMLGKRVDFDGTQISTSTVLLFMMEAVFDMRDNLTLCNTVPNAISLDGIVSSFHRAMRDRKHAAQAAVAAAQPGQSAEMVYGNP